MKDALVRAYVESDEPVVPLLARFGVSTSTFYRLLRERSVELRRPNRKARIPETARARILEMRSREVSFGVIARVARVHRQTAWTYAKAAGLTR